MTTHKELKVVTLPRLLAMTHLSLLVLLVLTTNASDDLPNNHNRRPTGTVGNHSSIGFSVNTEHLLIIDVSINITTLDSESADNTSSEHSPISMFYQNIDTRFVITVDDFDSIYGSDDTDRKEEQASAGKTLIDVAHEVRLGSDIKCRSSRSGDRKAMELRHEESYYVDENNNIIYNCVGIVHILLPLSSHATNASKLDNFYVGEDDLYSSSTPIIVAIWVSSNCENNEIDTLCEDHLITNQLVHLYEMVTSISLQANYYCLHYSSPNAATVLYPNPNNVTDSGVKDALQYRTTRYIYYIIIVAVLVYLNRLIQNDKQNRIATMIDNDNIHTTAATDEDYDYSDQYQESDDEHHSMMDNDDASERSKQSELLSRNVDYESSLDDDDANVEILSNPPSLERRATSSTNLNWLSTEPHHQHNFDVNDIVSIVQPIQETSISLINIAATSMHHVGNDCTTTTHFISTTPHKDIVQELAVDRNAPYSSADSNFKQFELSIQKSSMNAVDHTSKHDNATFETVAESCPIASSRFHESSMQAARSNHTLLVSNTTEKSAVNLLSFVHSIESANIDTHIEGVEHDSSCNTKSPDAMHASLVTLHPTTYRYNSDVDETIDESILPLPNAPRIEITKHTPSAYTCLADNTVTVSNNATKRIMNSHTTEKLDEAMYGDKNSVAVTPKCLEFIDHPTVPRSKYKRSRVVFHSDLHGDDEDVIDDINCKTDQSAPSDTVNMSTNLSLINYKCDIKQNTYEGLDLKRTSESTTIPTLEMYSIISSNIGSIKSPTIVEVKPSTTDETTLKQGSHKKRSKFAGTVKATTGTAIAEKIEKSTSEIADTKSPDDDFSYVSTLPPNSICSNDTMPMGLVNDLTASSPKESVLVAPQQPSSPQPYQLYSAEVDAGDKAESFLTASRTYLRSCNQEHTVRPDVPISNALLLAAEEVKENVWIYDESGNGSIVRTWTTKKRDKSLPKSISIQKKQRKRK